MDNYDTFSHELEAAEDPYPGSISGRCSSSASESFEIFYLSLRRAVILGKKDIPALQNW